MIPTRTICNDENCWFILNQIGRQCADITIVLWRFPKNAGNICGQGLALLLDKDGQIIKDRAGGIRRRNDDDDVDDEDDNAGGDDENEN